MIINKPYSSVTLDLEIIFIPKLFLHTLHISLPLFSFQN